MVDMGQADRTLRSVEKRPHHAKCWISALYEAAKEMGHTHYMDVPDDQADELKSTARRVQLAAPGRQGPTPVQM